MTDEEGAKDNEKWLKYFLKDTYKGEKLDYQYLLNPSHIAGAGDIFMSIYQDVFDQETVKDYDLIEMIRSASEKITTQKILLVAHSQGNFYANSFYDTVTDTSGSVPAESIGVYGVANPASRVAGGGKWLTSDTDRIIAKLLGRILLRKIMPPNTHITLQSGDDTWGHSFSDVYLKYKGDKIISDIQSSLGQLKTNTAQDPDKPCITQPELTTAHKIEGAILATADPMAQTTFSAVNRKVDNLVLRAPDYSFRI